MAKVIKERVITLNELITQCNLAVKNMQNERTTTSDNRRILIFNCALALRQMQDTLTQVEKERDELQSKLAAIHPSGGSDDGAVAPLGDGADHNPDPG